MMPDTSFDIRNDSKIRQITISKRREGSISPSHSRVVEDEDSSQILRSNNKDPKDDTIYR